VDPQAAVPRALRRTLATLALFYVGGLAIVVAIVPWNQIGLGESPFVRVFEIAGLPAAKHIMNFVVLSAALSSATCNLYFCSRLLFSLSRGTYAPAIFGRLSKRGMPVPAVLASSLGMAAALLLEHFFQNSAFVFMIGVAFFGGPFVWAMTLVTHVSFRRKMVASGRKILEFAPLGIWTSVVGAVALVGVLISTWWVPAFHVALMAGPPWLLFVTACYWVWRRRAGVWGGVAWLQRTLLKEKGAAPGKANAAASMLVALMHLYRTEILRRHTGYTSLCHLRFSPKVIEVRRRGCQYCDWR
jgi:L-asparagine transporter-like permease